jgi:hypothetical protein
MKNQTFFFATMIAFLLTLSGCEVIGGIFKTGMGVGVIISIAVVVLIIFLFVKLRGNRK